MAWERAEMEEAAEYEKYWMQMVLILVFNGLNVKYNEGVAIV